MFNLKDSIFSKKALLMLVLHKVRVYEKKLYILMLYQW